MGEHSTLKKTILFLTLLVVIIVPAVVYAQQIDIWSGGIFYAELTGTLGTLYWGALTITHDGTDLPESNTAFISLPFSTPTISSITFPGANMKEGNHYYAALLTDTFNLDFVRNVTIADIQEGGLFSETLYPMFYPGYNNKNDNPFETFCCDTTNVSIAGINYTGFVTTQNQNVEYYLLAYDDGVEPQPLFLVNIADQTCYDGTACVGQFMLPVPNQYHFFAINKRPVFTYNIWIDGVQTTTFQQTALPYELMVEVRDLYTDELVPDIDIAVVEENGQNIFLPYRLSGIVSETYSVGRTDIQARETFIVAPTVLPDAAAIDYTISVAVLFEDDTLANKEFLSVLSQDTTVQQQKPLTPNLLFDNAKTTVNAMNQINDFLFRWSSQVERARIFTLEYNIATNSFSGTLNTGEVQTGAPNVITATLRNGATLVPGFVVVEERGGHLIMNPVVQGSGLNDKERRHFKQIPTGEQFIITPTSLGFIESNITISFYDQNGMFLESKDINIDPTLEVSGGSPYNNDLLKTIVNAMNQIIASLFFALN